MHHLVSDHVVYRLKTWGVTRVFGYSGDGDNGLMGALGRAKGAMEFVQPRHEEMAAFMACGHAKFTGEVGVCMATSGPGAIHLLNGLYDAKKDHVPVVAIVGQQARTALGGEYQQEVDLVSLFKDVAGDFVHMATSPGQIRHLIDRAIRIALGERTVTAIIIPNDLQSQKAVEEPAHAHGTVHSGAGLTSAKVIPDSRALAQAAEVLNSGRRIAILIGAGARGAEQELKDIADLLGAGIAKALLGRDVLPDDLPYVTGSIGLLGTNPSWTLMAECDTLLMIGSSFPYSEFLPEEGQARGVQIDIEPRMLSMRYPMEVNLIGDSVSTLQALLPLLERKSDRSWQRSIESAVGEWWRLLQKRAMSDANPINPQRVFWDASERLPDNCLLTCDSGSAANWYARDLRFREGMRGSVSGGLASMGNAVPYAIAAKCAFSDRVSIAFVGDGAMQMNGNAELLTVSKCWRFWDDPRFIVVVLNNRDLNQVTWEMRVQDGDPKYEASQDLPAFSYARYAESLGFTGIEITTPEQIGNAWDQALVNDRPTILDFHTDPDVPPIPPHIEKKQAKAYMSAMLHGDPDALETIKASARQFSKSFIGKSP
ncbi:thiamine pyrophosphate-requiring protein [Chromohalobacter israelensis]|uniref:thiamine pyrophosphate-requiring protein n=1 Tax=Chromohalobacter israelensis TaxID=141390 RepID=UPI0015C41B8D|nr:thiamine pyrophosphate-requiring protein [Chromohalobacter salexigens]MDO0946882.1 thiamine pyrophosphate-requiring protein [Chromohalobacter salexigens]NWO57282.1 thiamine pyrophosphate-requiring protein [Chromohalobacter salexigens]